MNNLKEYFGDDKILITGASGLVGRNLFEYFKKQDLNVIGTYYSHSHKDLINCDLTDYKQTKRVLEDVKYVFMLATKTYGAGIMSTHPEVLIRENLAMNSNILELCYYNKVKKVLYISSSTVYQEANYPIKEEELDLNKDPFSLYYGVGWVKRYTEKLCEFYNKLGLNIVMVRPGNIYGKYDKYNEKAHFIPAIIKRILDNQNPLIIWGTGEAYRNLIFVEDLIRDILLVMMNYNSVSPLNISSDTNASVKEIVDLLIKIANYKGKVIYDPNKPDAIKYRSLDRTKFNNIFGKQDYTSLEEGLTYTLNWIKNEK